MADPIRIANCSGFFGDRLSAAREMVEDGPIDVLTGDWLAELTMLILARTRSKRPERRLRAHLRHPDGTGHGHLPRPGHQGRVERRRPRSRRLCRGRGRSRGEAGPESEDRLRARRRPDAAHAGSDRRRPAASLRDRRAHQGCIVLSHGQRLPSDAGASSTPSSRAPTSSSPAAPPTPRSCAGRRPGTTAGRARIGTPWPVACTAGHVIECSTQATGGNYSFFTEVPGMTRAGFPWAEVARRIVGDRQARRNRRRGVRRHRHLAAPVRDRRVPNTSAPM